MKGELQEIMNFKKQLDALNVKSRNPFSNIYRKWKKKRLINETGFEYCQEFLREMNYYTLRNVCRIYNDLCDNSYAYNTPFYDDNYDRDLLMNNLRVIMGDYYVELHIDLKVKYIPMVSKTKPYDHITDIKYKFLFDRNGYIEIHREVLTKYGDKEENTTVDGKYYRSVTNGIYEYAIIKNTFYKALTHYILKFLNT